MIQNKHKLILIDLIAPLGHINLINKLISILEVNFSIIFISHKTFCDQIRVQNKIELEDNLLPQKKSRIRRLINLIKTLIEVKKIIKPYDKDITIYIIGFENISYALFGFKRRKVLLQIHNNLSKSFLSLFFLKKISTNNSFIVYEEYIKQGWSDLRNSIYTLHHPLNFTKRRRENNPQNYIFIPSKVNNLNIIQDLIKFAKTRNLKVIFRSEFELKESDLLITKSRFNNYEELFNGAKYIGIISPYNYRVNGVFYEAMLFNKKIITLGPKGIFMNEMKILYPNSFIKMEEESNNQQGNMNLIDDYSQFLSKHNDAFVLDQFQKIVKTMRNGYS